MIDWYRLMMRWVLINVIGIVNFQSQQHIAPRPAVAFDRIEGVQWPFTSPTKISSFLRIERRLGENYLNQDSQGL